MRMILRLLGSKVGDQAVIGEFSSGAIDLIAIGEGATIGASVIFSNAEVVGGELVIGTVEIGANAYIGTSCVLGCNSAVGAGTELLDLTSIAPGQKTGPYELWDGSPGAVVGKVEADAMTSPPHVSPFTKTLQLLVYIASAIVLPAIGILPIFPAFLAFDWIDSKLGKVRTVVHYAVLPFIAWGTSIILIALTVIFIAIIRWRQRQKEGRGAFTKMQGGCLFGVLVVLRAQMDRRTRCGSHAGYAQRHRRHCFHALVVPTHGFQDWTRRGDLFEFRWTCKHGRDWRQVFHCR